jgi:hypothetical protein
VSQRVGGLGWEPPSAEEGVINDLVHASERVLDEGEIRDLGQIIETLVDAVTQNGPGS